MNINPTIAITGANGKIGSNLTEELRKLNLNFIKLNQLELIDETAIELNLDGRHIDTIIDLGWDTKNRGT
jgi:dTDP-4-dehydrorhamnose reductase